MRSSTLRDARVRPANKCGPVTLIVVRVLPGETDFGRETGQAVAAFFSAPGDRGTSIREFAPRSKRTPGIDAPSSGEKRDYSFGRQESKFKFAQSNRSRADHEPIANGVPTNAMASIFRIVIFAFPSGRSLLFRIYCDIPTLPWPPLFKNSVVRFEQPAEKRALDRRLNSP
jgi:hypothetical protein